MIKNPTVYEISNPFKIIKLLFVLDECIKKNYAPKILLRLLGVVTA